MNSNIILGRILQKAIDSDAIQVTGYNRFIYQTHSKKHIIVLRENGNEAKISFDKLRVAIEGYQKKPSDYNLGPGHTRTYGITHINSPLWSLLHLLKIADYTE